MTAIAIVATLILLAGALERVVLMSYLGLVLVTLFFASAAIERHDTELGFEPYRWLVGGLLASFVIGFTVIWLTYQPGATAESYQLVLGLPVPTAAFVFFLWIVPIAVGFYYTRIFDELVNDEVLEAIRSDAAEHQREETVPLQHADGPIGGDD
jgi:hypothetical protein